MEEITYTKQYFCTEYRLMKDEGNVHTEIARGSIDTCIAAREKELGNDYSEASFQKYYFQGHYPLGHPDFPGSGACWVYYDPFRG
jgi:hypothetical protein